MTKVWQRHIEEVPTQKTAFRGKDMWQDFWRRPLGKAKDQSSLGELGGLERSGREIFRNCLTHSSQSIAKALRAADKDGENG